MIGRAEARRRMHHLAGILLGERDEVVVGFWFERRGLVMRMNSLSTAIEMGARSRSRMHGHVGERMRCGDHGRAGPTGAAYGRPGRAFETNSVADVAVGAGLVLHRDRLAKLLRQVGRKQPRIRVGTAARREADDDADRPAGIVLRRARRAEKVSAAAMPADVRRNWRRDVCESFIMHLLLVWSICSGSAVEHVGDAHLAAFRSRLPDGEGRRERLCGVCCGDQRLCLAAHDGGEMDELLVSASAAR